MNKSNGIKDVAKVEVAVTRKGQSVTLFQLENSLDASARSRANANVLFAKMFDIVSKTQIVVVLNGELNGGVVYLHNKGADKQNKYVHAEDVKLLIEQVTGRKFKGLNSTETEQGGLVKIAYSLNGNKNVFEALPKTNK